MANHLSTSPKRLHNAAQAVLDGIFEEQTNALKAPFSYWLGASKPFLAFAQNYIPKIRKKVRMCRDIEELYNLYAELRTAYLLLQEPKFAVAYEPYAMDVGRSADYAVTFRTNMVFHVEVTRMRLSMPEQAGVAVDEIMPHAARRLVDVVCDKVQQLVSDSPNILWIWSESQVIPTLDVGQILLELKQRVEQRDVDVLARYGYAKPADFMRYYQRLSALVLFGLRAETTPQKVDPTVMVLWLNKDARYPIPSKVGAALRSVMVADKSPSLTRLNA